MCSKQNIYVELFLVSSIEQSIELNMIGLWLSTLGTVQRLPTGSSSIVGRILKLKKIDRICSKRHKSHWKVSWVPLSAIVVCFWTSKTPVQNSFFDVLMFTGMQTVDSILGQ